LNISHENPGIVCFGDSDWWYHNRSHMDMQIMKRCARLTKVLYVNSIVIRKFNIKEGTMFLRRVKRKFHSIVRGIRPSGIKNMTIYSPFSLPVHHINFARQLNAFAIQRQIRRCMNKLGIKKPIIWVACPGAAQIALKLPHLKLVYQRSDCYEELPCIDSCQIKKYDQLLKREADLVIYVNRALMRKECHQCKKSILLDHGVDFDIFAGADHNEYIPEDIKTIPHPVLGFYGNIDNHTCNIELIEQIADILTDISIVLVGNSSVDLSRLAARRNIYILGQKPYDQIPHYAKCFDVCFMPWQQNEWIKACNPIKLKEYLALGKPIVSTPFTELESYKDLVDVAFDAISFAGAVKKAFNENTPELVSARRRRVINCTWEEKAKEVLSTLCQANQAKAKL